MQTRFSVFRGLQSLVLFSFWMVLPQMLSGATITSTWADANGLWSSPANWNNGVPNNSGGNTYTAIISNGSNVSLDISATIDSLTLAAVNSLAVGNGLALIVNSGAGAGSISNGGSMTLNAAGGNISDLRTSGGGTVTLGGSGALTM